MDVQCEFWSETTQIPIDAARDEAWPAQARLATAREMLLTILGLEWRIGATSHGETDTGYPGDHSTSGSMPRRRPRSPGCSPGFDPTEIVASLSVAIDLLARAAAQTGALLSLPVLDVRTAVERHLRAVAS